MKMAKYIFFATLMVLFYLNVEAAEVTTNSPVKDITTRKGFRDNGDCNCANSQCKCCAIVDIPQIKLYLSLCIVVAYIPADVGVKLEILVNDQLILSVHLSAKNPPPVCFEIPVVSDLAKFCIILYDFDVSDNQFSGCARIEVAFLFILKANIPLGCFKIPVGDTYNNNLEFVQGSMNHDDQGIIGDVQGSSLNKQGRVNDVQQDSVRKQVYERDIQGGFREVRVYKGGKYEAIFLGTKHSFKYVTETHNKKIFIN